MGSAKQEHSSARHDDDDDDELDADDSADTGDDARSKWLACMLMLISICLAATPRAKRSRTTATLLTLSSS